MSTFFSRWPFLEGFNKMPPHLWQPNCTCWSNILIMYPIIIANSLRNVVEIGQAEGYSAWFLAHAATHNGGIYLGIDIEDTWNRAHAPFGYSLHRYFEGERLDCRFIQSDTMEMESIPDLADGGIDTIDFAYIDGRHETDYILHEVYDLILPKMRKDGFGYIALDDTYDLGAQGAFDIIKRDTNFEAVGFYPNGGFALTRVVTEAPFPYEAYGKEQHGSKSV